MRFFAAAIGRRSKEAIRRAGPASGILWLTLRLCRRHPQRPGCACPPALRRGRCDHHEPALHPRADAQADRALSAHCANLVAVGIGLGVNPAGGAVHAVLLGHRDHRPREMDSGLEIHRQRQPCLAQVRFPAQQRPRLPLARPERDDPCTAHQSVRAMRQALRAAAI